MVNDYLVSTFGFSPAKAATISKPIAHLKSPHNPDAVRSFLQNQGFGEAEIKTIIAGCPRILCSSLQNTIYPNLSALRDMGLSTSALTQIIVYGQAVLQLNSAVPRIKFWRDFLGGEEEALIKAFNANRCLICHDVNKGIAKKISLLQTQGISTNDVRWIICTIRGFIIHSVRAIEDTLKRAKKLGFHPQSGMFKHGTSHKFCHQGGITEEEGAPQELWVVGRRIPFRTTEVTHYWNSLREELAGQDGILFGRSQMLCFLHYYPPRAPHTQLGEEVKAALPRPTSSGINGWIWQNKIFLYCLSVDGE